MISNFISFLQQNVQKPNVFSINKGVVKLVNSNEDFWVKYSSNDAGFINCAVNNGKLDIIASKDNIEITVNLSQLDQCNVHLTAGLMHVQHLCKKSDIAVGSGNLNVKASKLDAGVIKAHVNVGILNNHSDLAVQNQVNQNQFQQGFGIFNYQNFMPNNMGMNSSLSLTGELNDYIANVNVGSGTLDIGL